MPEDRDNPDMQRNAGTTDRNQGGGQNAPGRGQNEEQSTGQRAGQSGQQAGQMGQDKDQGLGKGQQGNRDLNEQGFEKGGKEGSGQSGQNL